MRHKGNLGYYSEDRDRELLRLFHHNYHTRAKDESLIDYMKRVINMPAPSFFTTEERTGIALTAILRGEAGRLSEVKREMYSTILERVQEMQRMHPEMSRRKAIRKVISQSAPKFYITPSSALTALYKTKNKWKANRHI